MSTQPRNEAAREAGAPPARTAGPAHDDARPPATPTRRGVDWHRLRKATHLVCFAIFLILPFFDLMRFDIPHQRFYFMGQQLWISEFGTIFFALMFLMFLVAGAALLYGRVYCGYLCPQMIFSEASINLEQWLEKLVTRRTKGWSRDRRRRTARSLFFLLLVPASVFLAFIFIAYFVEPRDLLHRLFRFDAVTAGGIAGLSTTILTFLDFAFLRLRFCTSVCPYGYLQGFLSDDHTLHVVYQDEGQECIECKKCIKVCHMGIDIRDSPRQIECVHCGECIDTCVDVMGRLNKSGLIHYNWGPGVAPARARTWYQKIGLWDARRVVIFLVLFGYGFGLWLTLAMRSPVLVRVVPDRSVLYRDAAGGGISNRFRITVANRAGQEARVMLAVTGLARAELSSATDSLVVAPGESLTRDFDVTAWGASPGVTPIRFVARWTPEAGKREYPMTFIAPEGPTTP